MQRRLAIVGIVFVVGFGLGYGTTWLLAGSPGPLDAAAPAEPLAAAAVEPPPAPIPSAAAPVVPAPAPAPVTPPVDLAADVTPTPDDAVLPEQVADAVDPDAVAAAPDAGPVPSAPVAAPARPASHPCVGRVCRLDFVGMAGGLPVRDAQLEDGQAVEWARQFGSASKLGFIPSGPSVNVEVRAVGFKDGVPIAASVLYRSRGKVLSGVISLTVGNKQLSLLAE